MTNPLLRRSESHERGRQMRKEKLNDYQTRQAGRLELIERVAFVVDEAISSFRTQIEYDERIAVHITSRFEGVPDVRLELRRDGAFDLVGDDEIPF
jgi:hypothetical protein